MTDAADKAAADDARAMELFETQRAERYAAEKARAFAREQAPQCLDCGELISEARLKAVPGAIRCTRDAARVEGQ